MSEPVDGERHSGRYDVHWRFCALDALNYCVQCTRCQFTTVADTSTKLQQGQRQSTSSTARQNCAPPEQPCQPGAGAKSWRFVACLRLCRLAQETLSFRRPPTSSLTSQDDESGSPVPTCQLGVHAFLASSGAQESSPIDVDAARLGCAISFQWRDHCRVHGQLGSMEHRKPIGDDFQTTTVHALLRHQVKVPHHDVGGDTGTCLAANTCCSAFHREGSAAQHSCSSACCAVVAKRVQEEATPTDARGGRKGLPETTQQEHPENRGVKPSMWRRWEARERDACQRTTLRTEKSLLWDRQPWPHCAGDVVTMNRFCGDLLPTMARFTWFWSRAQPWGQIFPRRGHKPSQRQEIHRIAQTSQMEKADSGHGGPAKSGGTQRDDAAAPSVDCQPNLPNRLRQRQACCIPEQETGVHLEKAAQDTAAKVDDRSGCTTRR